MFISLLKPLLVMGAVAAFQFTACASELTLLETEKLILDNDVLIAASLSEAQSLAHLSVSESNLPNPVIKLGLLNMPVDDLGLDSDPMSQTKISLSQKFTKGGARKDTQRLYQQQEQAMLAQAHLQKLQLLLKGRILWLSTFGWQSRRTILKNDEKLFIQLRELTLSLYEVGKRQQQDVLRSDLELAMLQQKLLQADLGFSESRLNLAAIAGSDVLNRQWPTSLTALAPVTLDVYNDEIMAKKLFSHPQIQQWQYQLKQGQTQIDLVQSNNQWQWGAELAYGYRASEDTLGNERSDLVSAMVNVSIPLWAGNSNNKRIEASRLKKQTLQYRYDDGLRQLKFQAQAQFVQWQQLQQRRKFYASDLMNKADQHVAASLKAYESGVGDLSRLMRASIDRQKLKLDYLQLQVDEQKALATYYLILGEETKEPGGL